MKGGITLDLGILLEVTARCKQDYANWIFFNSRSLKRSAHFDTIANDYFRLLLVDANSILSFSKYIKTSFWQILNRMENQAYGENHIKPSDVFRWRTMLENSSVIIEKIKLLRDKKVYYVDNDQPTQVFISMGELQELLSKMEIIVLNMCQVLEYPITSIPTIEERCNHSIADAFKEA